MIIRLELEPGSVIDERATMEKLGVGRTPLREAITRLAAEKLVDVAPRRGTFVAQILDGDAWQIFEARMHIERLTARLAAERATPEQLERLESLFSSLPENYDFVGDADTDWKFHQGIVEASHNRHLMEVVARLYSQSVRLAYLRPSANPYSEVLGEYREVLTALRNRDPEGAEAAMARHIARMKTKVNFPGT
jgi:DNA-binding GntR family transcriptional regulator